MPDHSPLRTEPDVTMLMNRLVGLTAFAGLCLSLAAHVAALLGVDVTDKVPAVWLLHVGIFVVFIPQVLSSRKVFGRKPALADIRRAFPHWVVALGTVIVGYALLNFVLFAFATGGGNPDIRDGKFVLLSHGRLMRELSSAEYTAFKANEIRGFSGHWLAFYFSSFAYFTFRRPAEG
jgi:hypothetical protein